MGSTRVLRDVIVVGLGPSGAATSTMLREPRSFGIAGEALDVLAVEARARIPTRDRIVHVRSAGADHVDTADSIAGRAGTDATVRDTMSSIAGVESTFRDATEITGATTRYDTSVRSVTSYGHSVRVELDDGSIEHARFLVDATGGRLGVFHHGEPSGSSVYLTGQVPPLTPAAERWATVGVWRVPVHGAENDRSWSPVTAFNDARVGATVYVQYPSLPRHGDDRSFAWKQLARHLGSTNIDPQGITDARFLVTPLVRATDVVDGSMLAVGDTVRRVSPSTTAGVTNGLLDAHAAATLIQDATFARAPLDDLRAAYRADLASR